MPTYYSFELVLQIEVKKRQILVNWHRGITGLKLFSLHFDYLELTIITLPQRRSHRHLLLRSLVLS